MVKMFYLLGLLFTGIGLAFFTPLCLAQQPYNSSSLYHSPTVLNDTNHFNSNSTNIIQSNNAGLEVTEIPAVSCEAARIKCALRPGCGIALQSYMLDCADLLNGKIDHCDEFCKASLIALTSTEQGENLMTCLCSDNFCKKAKNRLEVCREEVEKANAQNAVVSCSVAHLICSADNSCSTALFYYDKFCRRMFNGRGCSFRCNNSISILGRQEKANKLAMCICDGTEPFPCQKIKTNMETLCFNQKDEKHKQKQEEETNEIDGGQPTDSTKEKNKKTSSTASRFGCHGDALGLRCLPVAMGWCVLVNFISVGLTSAMVVRWL